MMNNIESDRPPRDARDARNARPDAPEETSLALRVQLLVLLAQRPGRRWTYDTAEAEKNAAGGWDHPKVREDPEFEAIHEDVWTRRFTSWALSRAGLVEYETIDYDGDSIQGARFRLNEKGRSAADRLLKAVRLPKRREPK